MSFFPLYFWANLFAIFKGKIAKEDAIFEKSLFCEKFLEYDFTWKKCWFQIKIQNFILMTRPSMYTRRMLRCPGSIIQLEPGHPSRWTICVRLTDRLSSTLRSSNILLFQMYRPVPIFGHQRTPIEIFQGMIGHCPHWNRQITTLDISSRQISLPIE